MLRITFFFPTQNTLQWSGGTRLKIIFHRGDITQKRLRTTGYHGHVVLCLTVDRHNVIQPRTFPSPSPTDPSPLLSPTNHQPDLLSLVNKKKNSFAEQCVCRHVQCVTAGFEVSRGLSCVFTRVDSYERLASGPREHLA